MKWDLLENRLNTVEEINLTKIVKYTQITADKNNYSLLDGLKAWEYLYQKNNKKLDVKFNKLFSKSHI